MPLNTLRLNHQASSHPNDRIVFIKPLPRSSNDHASYETADLLLRAIAAQCLPIMKSHYLSVTTLEEHEHNPEFIGRNFNNGEIIQLVLKSKSGSWLPVNIIQMVMMHELAHNVHMNHGKGFWATRNKFAEEMRGLWARGYTGDGLWGAGQTVGDLGRAMHGNVVGSEQLKDLPLCGGTFRSRGRKRKRAGDDLSWREKRDRRIEKKFGKNGVALGEDDAKRLRLDLESKGPLGVKPRVAKSKRGRELRAAAALARFGSNSKEVEAIEAIKREQQGTDEDGSEYEEDDTDEEDAKDVDGQRLLDSKGKGMIRVCDVQQDDVAAVKREMDELEELSQIPRHPLQESVQKAGKEVKTKLVASSDEVQPQNSQPNSSSKSLYDIPQHSDAPTPMSKMVPDIASNKPKAGSLATPTTKLPTQANDPIPNGQSNRFDTSHTHFMSIPLIQPANSTPTTKTCPICSMENSAPNPTCLTCAHVLDPRKDPRHWSCKSATCKDSSYLNAGDCGICGVCYERRSPNT